MDLEAAPLIPQLSLTKPFEAVLVMAKELESKERDVTWVYVPLMVPRDKPFWIGLEVPLSERHENLPVEPDQIKV